MIKDKVAFAGHLDRLATSDLERVIVAHHQIIADHPAETLRRVAATLVAPDARTRSGPSDALGRRVQTG